MSSPSTPRSTRSASPAGNSPNMLTPGQKIKAMMAQFDSDSESDNQATRPKNETSKLDFGNKNASSSTTRDQTLAGDSSDDSDADDIVRPKGRMAARMQSGADEPQAEEDSAFARLSKSLRMEKEQATKPHRENTPSEFLSSGDDEDLPAAAARRNKKVSRGSPETDHRSSTSSPRARSEFPLFVSPSAAPQQDPGEEADEENKDAPKGNARFLALVAQKRKEREEREKIEAEQKAARRARMEQFSSEVLSGDESQTDDPRSAEKLTQKPRQARKASKKALEEMHRETQRMSRNMQLAHQAQTKKKITKESFFARFNFGSTNAPAEPSAANSSSTAGSQQSSDAEGNNKTRDTPHTSPVLGPVDSDKVTADSTKETQSMAETQAGPEGSVAQTEIQTATNQPKDTTTLPILPSTSKREPVQLTRPAVRVLMSRQEVASHQKDDSEDDDLEVVTSPSKCQRIAAFENLPARKMQESTSMTKLKALAHLTSPTRKSTSMNTAELSASLLQRARQQAAKERHDRIEELRAKGVVIETAEERAAMEDDLEDLVEKARREADEIKRQEKAAKQNGQDLDEEDDGDYEFSGSDDELADDEDDDDARSADENEGLFEQEANEDDESEGEQSENAVSDVESEVQGTRRKRQVRVVSDDEEEDEEKQIPSTPIRPPSNAPQSAERPVFPGMETPNMSIGLTQAFAGTLADDDDAMSQPGSTTMPFSMPDPGQPVPQLRTEESEILVRDSQEQPNERDFMAAYSPNVARVSESPAGRAFSEYSQLPDPTQDQGFVFSPFDPAKRFRGTPPISTVDTVLVDQSQSPIAERKGKHLRRGRATELSMVEEQEEEGDFEVNANAFNVLKKAAKKPFETYDKKTSKAKDIVDEAAEESEDEYAGLGGNSDESDGEEDAMDRQMINDNSGETVDEGKLAAMNADHQRNRDEKEVAKLMRDITTGALRRRRGAADDEFDLDDSDDERLARRREKQREFAKMRRALLADDKVGELADNPKKAAFFKAIEDREMDDDFEIEFLEEKESDSQNESSQNVAADGSNASDDSKKRKRPLEPSAEDATNRPPPHLRRTPASAMSKKPATLAEIRETLSFLTETPEYDSFHEDASLDDEEAGPEEQPGAEDDSPFEDARPEQSEGFTKPTNPRRTRGPVVDRLALLRQASSNSATAAGSGSSNTKMAFQTGGNQDGPIGFRPPQLLRRVTTGSSSSSSSSSSSNRVSKPAASGPKKGGAVNSYTAAREKERERQLRMKQRGSGSNYSKLLAKHASNSLGSLAGKGQWE